MGAASIGFIATANATLQLTADPAMRGRVMALYAMAFLGTTPIGAPLVGAIAQWTNPRVALMTGAVATVVPPGCSCGASRPDCWRQGHRGRDPPHRGGGGRGRRVAGWADRAAPVVDPVPIAGG